MTHPTSDSIFTLNGNWILFCLADSVPEVISHSNFGTHCKSSFFATESSASINVSLVGSKCEMGPCGR